MHVYLWDAKGSELYMRPIIQEGIPLTAKSSGFQRSDGLICGHPSISLLTHLLQMDPVMIWASSP